MQRNRVAVQAADCLIRLQTIVWRETTKLEFAVLKVQPLMSCSVIVAKLANSAVSMSIIFASILLSSFDI